jgi:hypothetical protein
VAGLACIHSSCDAYEFTFLALYFIPPGYQKMEEDGFDFEEALREIHVELEDLNTEAVRLAATIKKNFEELGI